MANKTTNGFIAICLSALLLPLAAGQCLAGYAKFDSLTDTIQVSGNSIMGEAATYEARVMLTGNTNAGLIFNEWVYGTEDKSLRFNPEELVAYAFPINHPNGLSYQSPISLNEWHHIAYVYDGLQERLYLDGIRVASRAWDNNINGSHSISNYPGTVCQVGSTYRWDSGTIDNGFIGLLDTVRISSNARYSGDTLQVPIGDLESDTYTQLLYNFNETSGSSTVTDLSAYGRTGTLGTGFAGATAPELVPEPSSILALLCGIGAIGCKTWRMIRK